MRLLLADDHTLFREALVQYIERSEPESEVLIAKDFHEVMDIMQGETGLDLILLDLRMPGMDDLQGLERLRAEYPDVPAALLSGLAEKHHVEKAMELGAVGYFPKTMSGKAMLNGFHKVLSGEDYVATDYNNNTILPSYYGEAENKKANVLGAELEDIKLTPREAEVLSFLLKGFSNKEIANALDLQIVTVKLHVRGVCRKLKAKNRTQAALIAQQLGLVEAS